MINGKDEKNEVTRRLDVIIALLAAVLTKGDDVTTKDKILLLSSFGLSSGEIAAVIGKKTNYVSKELSVAKSKERTK